MVPDPAGMDALERTFAPRPPSVADVVLTLHCVSEVVVVPAGLKKHEADTSQSPAVSDTDVALAVTPEVREVPDVVLLAYSPTLPASHCYWSWCQRCRPSGKA